MRITRIVTTLVISLGLAYAAAATQDLRNPMAPRTVPEMRVADEFR